MDPISALIMAGGSIAGGLMNTSSAQSINAAQLQFAQQQLGYQQQVSKGAFLPQYYQNVVQGANAAGLSPLAVLGVNAPSVSAHVGSLENPRPGDAVSGAAAALAQMKDPHTVAMERLQEKLGVAQIAKLNSETSQAKVDAARGAMINDALTQGQNILNQIKSGLDTFASDYRRATSVSWPDVGSGLKSMGQGVQDWLLGTQKGPGGMPVPDTSGGG